MAWRPAAALSLLLTALFGAGWMLWPRPAAPLPIVVPTPRPSPTPLPMMVVHVAGAVANPGVYQLPPGARVEDALALAGGLTEEADPAALNLAARLSDGQQVNARPRVRPSSESTPGAGARLNLNLASAADLDALPGVGPVIAQRIVERRQRLGPFQSVEQLRDEKLVPASTFERLKDLVTAN